MSGWVSIGEVTHNMVVRLYRERYGPKIVFMPASHERPKRPAPDAPAVIIKFPGTRFNEDSNQ